MPELDSEIGIGIITYLLHTLALIMDNKELKTERVNYKFQPNTKILLSKIAKIESRSMNNALEVMILEKGKQYGLIESRE